MGCNAVVPQLSPQYLRTECAIFSILYNWESICGGDDEHEYQANVTKIGVTRMYAFNKLRAAAKNEFGKFQRIDHMLSQNRCVVPANRPSHIFPALDRTVNSGEKCIEVTTRNLLWCDADWHRLLSSDRAAISFLFVDEFYGLSFDVWKVHSLIEIRKLTTTNLVHFKIDFDRFFHFCTESENYMADACNWSDR